MTVDDDLAGLGVAGLRPGTRYRCSACGNVTRFDVFERSRTRRYLHLDLAGRGVIEEEEVLDHQLEAVVCRWCGPQAAVRVEPTPGHDVG